MALSIFINRVSYKKRSKEDVDINNGMLNQSENIKRLC